MHTATVVITMRVHKLLCAKNRLLNFKKCSFWKHACEVFFSDHVYCI